MAKSLDLLQELQDAYASLCNMTITMFDSEGNWVTHFSGINSLTKLILEYQKPSLQERVRKVIDIFSQITKPIMYEHSFPGIKFILAPVRIGEKTEYFIWAGVIVEEQTRELLREYFDTHMEDPSQWIKALATVSDTTEEVKQELLDSIGNLAKIVSDFTARDRMEAEQKQKFDILQEVSDLVGSPDLTVPTILERFLKAARGIDFLGAAEKTDEESFSVTHILSTTGGHLAGTAFSTGEGFLGQVSATGTFGFWENISRDPRTLFFTQKNLHPHSLFCYPVLEREEVIALLFGGSFSDNRLKQDDIDLGRIIARLLAIHKTQVSLQQRMNAQMLRLSVLLEICQVLNVVQDLKRILLILVDMSLNLVQGPFSCVLLRERDADGTTRIVSRGLTAEQIDQYRKDLTERYFATQSTDNPQSWEAAVHETGWGTPVAECPIVYEGQIQGILSVGLGSKKEMAEYQTLLSGLSVMGGVAIQHLQDRKNMDQMDQLVGILHRSMEQWDYEAYKLTADAKELAVSFAKYFGLSVAEIRNLAHACLLSRYDFDFLKETLPSPELLAILKEYEELVKEPEKVTAGSTFYGSVSQIVALVLTYLLHKESTEILSELVSVSTVIRENFIVFLDTREVANRQISIDKQISEWPLTSREQQVMHLVIKGLSNREIAAKLFISEHTVKNHMSNIFQKLGVSDRTQLIAKAYRSGYAQTPDSNM
ncbi:LuxR C-terminal-related transcriptional regulator [Effusibacillus lacus]|uniref:HTH luxR-type domain-containing protein n=1 Tax=Effusibacillus lacus TaxID=1348429 RepID=A0A292YMM2_9BACL|nr:LuxR C-terminal-related transcriptional regulator [Effusibacillus lacus]TCS76846.1 PocR sensory domain-containing protein [Effusibacillus lacus]GAX91178.1 hypothetical protein EFBL_2844 [Effusibacillus lacus]